MISAIRKRTDDRRQLAKMTKIIESADPRVRDELIIMAQRQGLL